MSLPFESSASCCKASAASMVELVMVALLPPVAKRATRLSAIIAMRFCCSELSAAVSAVAVTVLTVAVAVGAMDEASSAIWAVWPVLAWFASAALAGAAFAGTAMHMLPASAAAVRMLMLLCAVIKALLLAVVWGGAVACGGLRCCRCCAAPGLRRVALAAGVPRLGRRALSACGRCASHQALLLCVIVRQTCPLRVPAVSLLQAAFGASDKFSRLCLHR